MDDPKFTGIFVVLVSGKWVEAATGGVSCGVSWVSGFGLVCRGDKLRSRGVVCSGVLVTEALVASDTPNLEPRELLPQ